MKLIRSLPYIAGFIIASLVTFLGYRPFMSVLVDLGKGSPRPYAYEQIGYVGLAILWMAILVIVIECFRVPIAPRKK